MPGMFDEPRADDAAICPFLRQQQGAAVAAPVPMPDAANACIATGEPRPQSLRQQELLCLHLSHADCPRYLRGGLAGPEPDVEPPRRTSRLPRATVAALLVLVLSAGLSFGFVLRRGGIDLPSFAAASATPSSTVAAVVPSGPAETPSPGVVSPSPDVTAEPSVTPSDAPSPSPLPSDSPAPSPTPVVTPSPGPTPTPAPVKVGSASRMKLVTACPGVPNCYIYKIGTYGTIVDISTFFGVSVKSIYALNPGLNPRTLHHGQKIKIPTPTR
jgi:hypothetical protein